MNTNHGKWMKLLILTILTFIGIAASTPMALAVDKPTAEELKNGKAHWSATEKWVWQKIRQGEYADLNKLDGKELDPGSEEGWDKERKLSAAFLEEILFNEPWASAVHRKGVRVGGAYITNFLDFENGSLIRNWFLHDSRVVNEMVLKRLKTDSSLSFKGSHFSSELNMASAKIGGSLYMRYGADFTDVNMHGVEVGHQLSMVGGTFRGRLNMDSIKVGENLFMRDEAEFAYVNLIGAEIGDQLDMSGATFSEKLIISSSKIGGSLYMREGAEFADVYLIGAKIGSSLDMNYGKFNDKLNMNSVKIGGSLFMHEGAEFEDVDLGSAEIGDQLDMSGAIFSGKLDMDSANIRGGLFMSDGAEFAEVNLMGLKVGGHLSMRRGKFNCQLDMSLAKIEGSLLMVDGAEFAVVDMINLELGGKLSMSGGTFNGQLGMNSVKIGGSLFMVYGDYFEGVDLVGSEIGGQFDTIGGSFKGKLNMKSAKIGAELLMDGAEFADVDLQHSEIGSKLDMSGSQFSGTLEMSYAKVGTDLLIGNKAEFEKPINARFIEAKFLDLAAAAKLSGLDLTGAQITAELHISEQGRVPIWKADSPLILRNASTVALHYAQPEHWPSFVDLQGFTYQQLGGDGFTDAISESRVEWFLDWLAKKQDYAPQPYNQLAGVMADMGHSSEANLILYASHEEARKQAWDDDNYLDWLGNTLLKNTIGYGLGWRYFISVFWVLLLVFIGQFFLKLSGQHLLVEKEAKSPWLISFFYSLDLLLPIVQLRDHHYKIDLQGATRYYFYFHQLMGYVLASFLVAGLSGITQ